MCAGKPKSWTMVRRAHHERSFRFIIPHPLSEWKGNSSTRQILRKTGLVSGHIYDKLATARDIDAGVGQNAALDRGLGLLHFHLNGIYGELREHSLRQDLSDVFQKL